MKEEANFTSVLRAFMARARCGNQELSRLTGISVRTIEKWTAEEKRRPRYVTDLLKLARVLLLDAEEVSALLQAAGHPPLAILQTQVGAGADTQLLSLLSAWDVHEPSAKEAQVLACEASATARHQLRLPVADFVGRGQEAAQLVAAMEAALSKGMAVIGGVHGMGGVGKTELAYRVAACLHQAFPTAQIALALHGSTATPLPSVQAMQQVIHAFVPDARLPDDLDVVQRRYQAVLHQQHALILADDAYDAQQVRPLIPPAGSVLLITSRRRFTLPGMVSVNIDPLSEDEAVALLRAICARLSICDAQAIARACGRLPLALRVSASILRTTPALPVVDCLAQLADDRRRLGELRDPDDAQLDVAASLALSYAQLDLATQGVFRQLGVLVADFAPAMVQTLVAAPDEPAVRSTLYLLLRRNLIIYDSGQDRWWLHDLVRDLARRELETAGELEETMWRYARAAVQTAQRLQSHYFDEDSGPLAALREFDMERLHLDAGWRWAKAHAGSLEGDRLLLDYANATCDLGQLRFDAARERLPLWEHVLAAARRLGDRRAEGQALTNLGLVYADMGNMGCSIHYSEQAAAIAHELGASRGEAQILNNLGMAYWGLGELQQAMAFFEQSLTLTRSIDDPLDECIALFNLAEASFALEERDRAAAYATAALAIAEAIGASREAGHTLQLLARIYAQQEECGSARRAFEQALRILDALGDQSGGAECRWHFGLFLLSQEEQATALRLLRAAVAYEQSIGSASAEEHSALIARLGVGEAPQLASRRSG